MPPQEFRVPVCPPHGVTESPRKASTGSTVLQEGSKHRARPAEPASSGHAAPSRPAHFPPAALPASSRKAPPGPFPPPSAWLLLPLPLPCTFLILEGPLHKVPCVTHMFDPVQLCNCLCDCLTAARQLCTLHAGGDRACSPFSPITSTGLAGTGAQ